MKTTPAYVLDIKTKEKEKHNPLEKPKEVAVYNAIFYLIVGANIGVISAIILSFFEVKCK